MSTPSERSSRWFWPPPQRTAYFSIARRPGTVLRVSRIRDFVPETASTYCRVTVAMPLMQPHAIENLRMRSNLVVTGHSAVDQRINVQNARDASDARKNTILFGQNGGRGPLVGINAGVAGGIMRGPVFEQRVLQNCCEASAIPIHSFLRRDSRPRLSGRSYFNFDKLNCAFSRRIFSSSARFRSPSTTWVGALAKNPSLPS